MAENVNAIVFWVLTVCCDLSSAC